MPPMVSRAVFRSTSLTCEEWTVSVPATQFEINDMNLQASSSYEWSTEKTDRTDITQPVWSISNGRIMVSYTYKEEE